MEVLWSIWTLPRRRNVFIWALFRSSGALGCRFVHTFAVLGRGAITSSKAKFTVFFERIFHRIRVAISSFKFAWGLITFKICFLYNLNIVIATRLVIVRVILLVLGRVLALWGFFLHLFLEFLFDFLIFQRFFSFVPFWRVHRRYVMRFAFVGAVAETGEEFVVACGYGAVTCWNLVGEMGQTALVALQFLWGHVEMRPGIVDRSGLCVIVVDTTFFVS